MMILFMNAIEKHVIKFLYIKIKKQLKSEKESNMKKLI